jgi:hypothetical protein
MADLEITGFNLQTEENGFPKIICFVLEQEPNQILKFKGLTFEENPVDSDNAMFAFSGF